jgi:hypothetical protein
MVGKWLILLVIAAMAAASSISQETNSKVQATTITDAARAAARRASLPPRVVQAERFLAERGWNRDRTRDSTRGGTQAWAGAGGLHRSAPAAAAEPEAQAMGQGQGTATWLPLGPIAVQSQNFGLVTGRVSALALDPSDTTGNTLYVGTTGGGVWRSQNADTSSPANISFIPLTDKAPGMGGANGTSISIGALSVQPGGTGVILAGTGDPNDALDSYYGAGILRSTDGGITWSLISATSDQLYSFAGEGIAGFAWSTVNQQQVVMAVSQAYEGMLVNAVWTKGSSSGSYEGLYYSSDSGVTWSLARITDGAAGDVQGPGDTFAFPDGNAATSVVWNPVRQLFVAAVRYHGYYQSADGVTWTRMTNQPGAGLMTSAGLCPTNSDSTGSIACPIFRGVLAVNPQTGDTFAWTVDEYNQDQGIWQDLCVASAGACTNLSITFAQQWQTAALETNTSLGPATIENGDYNLALAAVPSGQTTIVLAGDNDLWKTNCPYSQGCRWRNTTNSTVGFCAQVGEYQHSLAWNLNNPLEIFVGNDSGLWRSTDAIGETGTVCSASDATHFQNLNGSLGSLAEVVSISQAGSTPYTMMAGLGANGTAGVKSTSGTTADWPEILGGEGGPVAIDPVNSNNWYVNNGAGVSIHLCSQTTPCTPTVFGSSPVVTDADVGGDGLSMTTPAPFLVDPLDNTKLLIGTCRVWRGPASGVGWSSGDAISPILDNHASSGPCSGNALIRSMAAMALPVSATLPSGGEVVYVGMYGSANGDSTLPGHVLNATYNSATGTWFAWTDLTSNPVTNDTRTMNYYLYDISSFFIDPHDSTGETVYVAVAGIQTAAENVQVVYRSTDGGAHWTTLMANLPAAPANSLVVDPQSASTVYVATDAGVYVTQQIGSCTTIASGCWTPLASGLPEAPVVALSAAPAKASVQNLVAATYGRGIWMTPLLGAGGTGSGPATDTLSVTSLSFPSTVAGQLSSAQTVTLTNSGAVPLTYIAVSVSGAFQQTNNCTANLAANSSCAISVQFDPAAAGAQTGTLSIADSLRTQPETVALNGTGLAPPVLGVSPASLTFSGTVGQTIAPQTVTVSNTGGAPLANVGFQINGLSASSFSCSPNTCSATTCSTLAAGASNCTVQVIFTPTAVGGDTASLVVSSSTFGVAAISVSLSGTGQTPAGLNVNVAQLAFPIVTPGQFSPAQTVTLTNNGGSAATSLTLTATPPFSLVQNTCGTTLSNVSGQNSCSTGVIFSPSLNGPYTGTLTITSPSLTASTVIPLSGTGGTPGSVQALPNLIAFPQTGVNLFSSPVTVTLTNPDSVNSLGSFSLSVSAGFRLVSTTCASTLAAGASCTALVEFAPTIPGPQSGSLTVTSSALPTGAFVPLTGRGFDFALAPSGSSSQTVANGQTADYKLLITPLLGGQGVFTFQCSALPPSAACTFDPASEGVTANMTGNIVVEIATGLTTASVHSSPPLGWPALPLACGLVLIPFAMRRQRKALLLVALLMILAGGVSSCTSSGVIPGGTVPGGGSGGGSGGGNCTSSCGGSGSGITSAGTYPVVVTATSNGVQHQATLTLTVD